MNNNKRGSYSSNVSTVVQRKAAVQAPRPPVTPNTTPRDVEDLPHAQENEIEIGSTTIRGSALKCAEHLISIIPQSHSASEMPPGKQRAYTLKFLRTEGFGRINLRNYLMFLKRSQLMEQARELRAEYRRNIPRPQKQHNAARISKFNSEEIFEPQGLMSTLQEKWQAAAKAASTTVQLTTGILGAAGEVAQAGFRAALEMLKGVFTNLADAISKLVVKSAMRTFKENFKISHIIELILDLLVIGFAIYNKQWTILSLTLARALVAYPLFQVTGSIVRGALQLIKLLYTDANHPELESDSGDELEEILTAQGLFSGFTAALDATTSGIGLIVDFISAIFTFVMSFIRVDVPPLPSLKDASLYVSFFNQSTTAMSKIKSAVDYAFRRVYKWYYGVPYLSSDEVAKIKDFQLVFETFEASPGLYSTNQVNDLHRLLNEVSSFLPVEEMLEYSNRIKSKTPTIATTDYLRSLNELLTKAKEKRWNYSKLLYHANQFLTEKGHQFGGAAAVASVHNSFLHSAHTILRDHLVSWNRDNPKTPATIVGIEGESRVGKDTAATLLADIVYQLLGESCKSQDIYQYKNGANFQENEGQKAFLLRDLFQDTSPTGLTEHLTALWTIREQGAVWDAAAIEDKGTRFDRTELAIFTMNRTPNFGTLNAVLSSPTALSRTFHRMFYLAVSPECSKADGTLDIVKYTDALESLNKAKPDFDKLNSIWRFFNEKPTPVNQHRIQWVNFTMAARIIANDIRERRQINHSIRLNLENIDIREAIVSNSTHLSSTDLVWTRQFAVGYKVPEQIPKPHYPPERTVRSRKRAPTAPLAAELTPEEMAAALKAAPQADSSAKFLYRTFVEDDKDSDYHSAEEGNLEPEADPIHPDFAVELELVYPDFRSIPLSDVRNLTKSELELKYPGYLSMLDKLVPDHAKVPTAPPTLPLTPDISPDNGGQRDPYQPTVESPPSPRPSELLQPQVRLSPKFCEVFGLNLSEGEVETLRAIDPDIHVDGSLRGLMIFESFLRSKGYKGQALANVSPDREKAAMAETKAFLQILINPTPRLLTLPWLDSFEPIPEMAQSAFLPSWQVYKNQCAKMGYHYLHLDGILSPDGGLREEPTIVKSRVFVPGALTLDEAEKALFPKSGFPPLLKYVAFAGLGLAIGTLLYTLVSSLTSSFELVAQAKSEYSEYVQVSQKTKKRAPVTGGVLQPQGIDSNVLTTTLRKAKKNLCYIHIQPPDPHDIHKIGPGQSANILRLGGNDAIGIFHTVRQSDLSRWPDYYTVFLFSDKPKPYVFDYKYLKMWKIGETDQVYIQLPPSCGLAPDIVDHIAKAEDFARSPLTEVFMVHRQEDQTIVSKDMGDCVEVNDTIRYGVDGHVHTVRQTAHRFKASTYRGECGSFYFTANTRFGQGSRIITDMHAYANTTTKYAVAIPLVQETIREARQQTAATKWPAMANSPTLDEPQGSTFLSDLPVVGQLPVEKRPFRAAKTDIRPSLLQQASNFDKPVTAPAKLRGNKTYEPMRVAASYIVRTPPGFPAEYDEFFTHSADNISARLGPPVLEDLPTWHEVINGIPAYGVPRIKLTASVGYTGDNHFPSSRRDLFTKVNDAPQKVKDWCESHLAPEDPDDLYPTPQLMNEIERIHNVLLDETVPASYVIDGLKDERRPLHKVENPRLYSYYELAAFLVFRRYTMVLSATMAHPQRRIYNGFLYGIIAQSREWDELIMLRESFVSLSEWDQEKFDKRLHPMLLEYMFRATKHLHPGREMAWKVTLASYFYSYVISEAGIVIQPYFRASSGHAGTTPFNCVCSVLLSEAGILHHQRKTGEKFSYLVLAYGDDTNICHKRGDETNTYGFSVQSEFQKPLGMFISSPYKDGKIVESISPRDAVMLKRTVKEFNGFFTCPLPLETIHETALWIIDGNMTKREATEVNAEAALRAMAEHGPQAFEDYRRRLNLALVEVGCSPITNLTFADIMYPRWYGTSNPGSFIRPISNVTVDPPPLSVSGLDLNAVRENNNTDRLQITDELLQAQSLIAQTQSVNQANLMAPVPADALPVSQSGLTSFVAGSTQTFAADSHTPADPRGPNPYQIDDMTKVLTRTYLVGSVSWTNSQPVGTQILDLEFPNVLATKAFISAKLQDFYYFMCDGYDITITYPSNPSYCGTLVVSRTGPVEPTTPVELYNANPILLAAGRNEEIKFFLPNACPRRLMTTDEAANTYFNHVILTPIGQLLSSTDPDASLNVSIFASFRNPRAIAPEPRGAIPILEAQSKNSMSESIDKATKGVLAGVSNAVGTISGIMEGAGPILDTLPLLSKPVTASKGTPSIIKPVTSFSQIEGVVEAERLTYNMDTLVANKDKIPGLDPNLTLVKMAKTPAYLGTYTTSAGDAPDTVIASFWLAPTALSSAGSGPGSRWFTPGFAAGLALHHQLWSGDIQYLFFVDLPATSSVTLSIAWWPDPATPVPPTEAVGGDIIRSVVTCNGPTVIKRRFPFISNQGLLDTYQSDSPIFSWAGLQPNAWTTFGQVAITVVQPVTSMGGAEENTVRIYAYGSTCDNFTLQIPSALHANVTYAVPSPVDTKGSKAPKEILQPQCDLQSEFKEDFETCVPTRNIDSFRIFAGENHAAAKVSSVFKIPTVYGYYTGGATKNFMWSPGETTGSPTPPGHYHWWLANCFLYWTGSYDVTLSWHSIPDGNGSSAEGNPLTRFVSLNPVLGDEWTGVAPMAIVHPRLNPVCQVHVPWVSQALVQGVTSTIDNDLEMTQYSGITFQSAAIGGISDYITAFVAGGEDFALAWLQWPTPLYWTEPALTTFSKRELKVKKRHAAHRLKAAAVLRRK